MIEIPVTLAFHKTLCKQNGHVNNFTVMQESGEEIVQPYSDVGKTSKILEHTRQLLLTLMLFMHEII